MAEERTRLVSHRESYTDYVCCSGYIGTPPNCISKLMPLIIRTNTLSNFCVTYIVTCPVLRNPANGNVDYTSNVYPSEAGYHCNLGYTLNGPSSRTCQSNGKWTGSQPSCRGLLVIDNLIIAHLHRIGFAQ